MSKFDLLKVWEKYDKYKSGKLDREAIMGLADYLCLNVLDAKRIWQWKQSPSGVWRKEEKFRNKKSLVTTQNLNNLPDMNQPRMSSVSNMVRRSLCIPRQSIALPRMSLSRQIQRNSMLRTSQVQRNSMFRTSQVQRSSMFRTSKTTHLAPCKPKNWLTRLSMHNNAKRLSLVYNYEGPLPEEIQEKVNSDLKSEYDEMYNHAWGQIMLELGSGDDHEMVYKANFLQRWNQFSESFKMEFGPLNIPAEEFEEVFGSIVIPNFQFPDYSPYSASPMTGSPPDSPNSNSSKNALNVLNEIYYDDQRVHPHNTFD